MITYLMYDNICEKDFTCVAIHVRHVYTITCVCLLSIRKLSFPRLPSNGKLDKNVKLCGVRMEGKIWSITKFPTFSTFLNEVLNPVYPNISIHILHIVFYIIIS